MVDRARTWRRGSLALALSALWANPLAGQESWTATTAAGAPTARTGHTAVWTGARMIVWGGNVPGAVTNGGSVFDPVANAWGGMTSAGAPAARKFHTAVWTGSRMIVWGGTDGSYYGFLSTGGIYDPASDRWLPTSTVGAPVGRWSHTAVWTGSKMIVWGGSNAATGAYYQTGGIYDPASNTWSPIATAGAPSARDGHTAVWTGSKMVVWGGRAADGYPRAGGVYDPAADAWSPTTETGSPYGRTLHSAVWTGSRMIVWGGYAGGWSDGGALYDPEEDTWSAMGPYYTTPPSARHGHTAVWTGAHMIVWGGQSGGTYESTGRVYTPTTGMWTSLLYAPLTGRREHTAVWTGSRMVVWGGVSATQILGTGGIYDPSLVRLLVRKTGSGSGGVRTTYGEIDCSADCSSAAFDFRYQAPVWLEVSADDDSTFAGWGGACATSGLRGRCFVSMTASQTVTASFIPRASAARLLFRKAGTGAGYVSTLEPDAYESPLGFRCGPECLSVTVHHPPGTLVKLSASADNGSSFTGWGGDGCGAAPWPHSCWVSMDGDKEIVATFQVDETVPGRWAATSVAGAPAARSGHTAVWTGLDMVVWGGSILATSERLGSGGHYEPSSDAWRPTSMLGAPSPRESHTAVWTGSRMIVWGGSGATAHLGDGGVYDPVADTWAAVGTAGAPAARYGHTAVWTGSKMIVWGGSGATAYLGDGGVYDPATDTWTAMSLSGAPAGRYAHTAVWTGSRMIVWGGYGSTSYLGDGGIYDPATDTWSSLGASGAPLGRAYHTAVWTGSRMIVWGGAATSQYGSVTGGGASYDPEAGAWQPLATLGAPTPRKKHTALWTGSRMLVWGGFDYDAFDTGGVYDPQGDAWRATALLGRPSRRGRHTAVWTGSQMVVWGGRSGESGLAYDDHDTGGRYDPDQVPLPQPDLTVSLKSAAPGSVAPGSSLDVGYEVANRGNAAAGASLLRLWLSADDVLDSGDASLTPSGVGVGALAAGQSAQATVTVTIPAGTAVRVWRVIAQADAADAVAEASEANNTAAHAFRVGRRTAVDFNADDEADLLWHHQVSGDLYTWQLQGTVTTWGSYLTPRSFTDTRWQIRGLADFDQDGNVDVLWHHQVTGDLYVWFLNGTVTVRGSYLTPRSFADTRWQIRGVADLDGDGKPDLLWHHQVTGDLYVWFLDGTVTVAGSYLSPPAFADTRWQIRALADFNGDGREDLLWHHQGNGELYVWYLYGTWTVAGSYLTPKAFDDTRWKIVSVADFDGDGDRDLLWHHQLTGDLYVWFLDGVVTVSGSYLTPKQFADTNWKIVPR